MRKAPTQARARYTVDCILDAAAYILAERGLAGFTTNHIAERAGVNVASLYQYFPNKEAIIAALQSRHAAQPDKVGEDWRARLRRMHLGEVIRVLVDGALATHAENADLHRIVLTQLPRSAHSGNDDERISQLSELILPKARKSEAPEMMLFAARHALLGVINEAICKRPHWLGSAAFRDELVRLLESYLAPRVVRKR